jgi:hypothetical protein
MGLAFVIGVAALVIVLLVPIVMMTGDRETDVDDEPKG